MKKLLLLCVGLAVYAAPAFAGLDLTWDACAGDGGASDKVLACADAGLGVPAQLNGTFSASSGLAGFLAMDGNIDLQTDSASLPDWWRFATPLDPAACNPGIIFGDEQGLGGPCTSGLKTLCSASFGPTGTECDVSFGYQAETGGVPNRGRMVFSVFRTAAKALAASTNYFSFHIDMYYDLATESTGPCDGCPTPTAIVWNQLTLLGSGASAGTSPEAEVVVIGPGDVSNCATANGGNSLCGATPTQNKSWGALKSLYR